MTNMNNVFLHRTGSGEIIEDGQQPTEVARSVGSTATAHAQVVREAVPTTHYDDRQTGADQFPETD